MSRTGDERKDSVSIEILSECGAMSIYCQRQTEPSCPFPWTRGRAKINTLMPKHFVVIDPAVVKPEIAAFNRMAKSSPLPLTVHFPSLFGTHTLSDDINDIAGVIVMGSKASVNEKLPWQTELGEWLKKIWEKQIPTLGFCYGHQLIGFLHGATVGPAFAKKIKKVGFREVTFSSNNLIGEGTCGKLYYSHEEAVLTVPAGMHVFGKSGEVAVEALEHDRLPIWSLQTHPETICVKEGVARTPNDLAFGHSIVDAFLLKCRNG